MTELVSDVRVVNKTGMRITAELQYSVNSGVLTIVLRDRVETIYLDINPDKNVSVNMAEVTRSTNAQDITVGEDKDENVATANNESKAFE